MFASISTCSASPEKPVMSQVPKEVYAGSTINVSCSVTHTCASHPPEFSWSVSNLTNEVEHTMMSRGVWQITSMITFTADGGDGVKHLTCTATFWRGKQQASTVTLSVKGQQFRSAVMSCNFKPTIIFFRFAPTIKMCLYQQERWHTSWGPRSTLVSRSLLESL